MDVMGPGGGAAFVERDEKLSPRAERRFIFINHFRELA